VDWKWSATLGASVQNEDVSSSTSPTHRDMSSFEWKLIVIVVMWVSLLKQ